MKIIENFAKDLGMEKNKTREWPERERLELLSIDADKKNRLEKCLFESIDFGEDERSPACFKRIEISCLVGINRHDDVNNWIALLLSLHKRRNFDIYGNRDSFVSYVNSLEPSNEDLPHVLEIDGKYYIDGNGKHRLTIAKCLELDAFPVLVSQLKNA